MAARAPGDTPGVRCRSAVVRCDCGVCGCAVSCADFTCGARGIAGELGAFRLGRGVIRDGRSGTAGAGRGGISLFGVECSDVAKVDELSTGAADARKRATSSGSGGGGWMDSALMSGIGAGLSCKGLNCESSGMCRMVGRLGRVGWGLLGGSMQPLDSMCGNKSFSFSG